MAHPASRSHLNATDTLENSAGLGVSQPLPGSAQLAGFVGGAAILMLIIMSTLLLTITFQLREEKIRALENERIAALALLEVINASDQGPAFGQASPLSADGLAMLAEAHAAASDPEHRQRLVRAMTIIGEMCAVRGDARCVRQAHALTNVDQASGSGSRS